MEQEVGQKRKFSFSDKEYRIREILNNPGITMSWTWNSGICPHCKEKIERTINHVFYRIEILGDDAIKDKNLTRQDIVLLGFTLDLRTMLLTTDLYDKVFEKSKDFKHLLKKKG